MADISIPQGNIADFRNEKIIQSKQPMTKEQVDTECRAGAMYRGIPGSIWTGVDLGTTSEEKDSLMKKTYNLFGKDYPAEYETVHNYGCIKTSALDN